jgi:hypothetical protein
MIKWTLGQLGKNKAKQSQTKPIKANLKKAKMNVTNYITMDYENKSPIWAPKKQSQFSKRQKPMQTLLPQRIMENTALSGYEKTNPTCRGVAFGEAGTNPMLARHAVWQGLPAISMAGQRQKNAAAFNN